MKKTSKAEIFVRAVVASDLAQIYLDLQERADIERARLFLAGIEAAIQRLGEKNRGQARYPKLANGVQLAEFDESIVILFRKSGRAVEVMRVLRCLTEEPLHH